MSELPPFHIALVVDDLASARSFYGGLLGCPEGRSAERWVDFDFFGHQLVCHLGPRSGLAASNPVDGEEVPVPHCGVVLGFDAWQALANRLEAKQVRFRIPPTRRFAGRAGEQGTFFLEDPAGNALEFKGFADLSELFRGGENHSSE